jgi:hypothetical protein
MIETELVAHYDGDRRVVVRLGRRIGGGAVGDIYRLQGRPGLVAKLYRTAADRAAYERKIADMIRDPPDLPPLTAGSIRRSPGRLPRCARRAARSSASSCRRST